MLYDICCPTWLLYFNLNNNKLSFLWRNYKRTEQRRIKLWVRILQVCSYFSILKRTSHLYSRIIESDYCIYRIPCSDWLFLSRNTKLVLESFTKTEMYKDITWHIYHYSKTVYWKVSQQQWKESRDISTSTIFSRFAASIFYILNQK